MTLLAVRLIDLAIFGTLGGLWIGGAFFVVVLYRWLIRYEREQGEPTASLPIEAAATEEAERPVAGAELHPRPSASAIGRRRAFSHS